MLRRTSTSPPAYIPVKTILFVLFLLVLLVVALAIAKKLGLLTAASSSKWPFYVKKPLTQPEQILYHRLVSALPEHIVLAQVQVSRVLGVRKGSKFNEWNNRINRLSYDFVVCGKDSTVIAGVELDDKSHQTTARVGTDEKKNKASADAGLKLVRWNVRALPDIEEFRMAFAPPLQIEPPPTNSVEP